ncbi:MAG TPA: hypothetical protein DCP91_09260 [Eggerthellaceae bacterium]|nr:hypothetical protein [Eggerthellaceae bacterium]
MLHGMVRDVRMFDDNPADPRELVEIRASFITDKSIVPDLLAALADEPYVALLGKDYEVAHEGRYAELRGDA